MDLSELIIQGAKWLGATGIAMAAIVESWRIYNKRKEAEAKENSAGLEAINKLKEEISKLKNDEITRLEKEISTLKNTLALLSSRDESIKDIVTKLETNYTGLLSRLLDQYSRGNK